MAWISKTNLLFLVILIEGYVVLSSELLGIRLLVPYVGSGVETTSIIIGGVLLSLAFGYHRGGEAFSRGFAASKFNNKQIRTIRHFLLRNILRSLVVFTVGFSYIFLEAFFSGLSYIGLGHRLISTALYVLIFLVAPMYWLGQTVPLTSHYFSKHKLSRITGRMFFFSTIGSFLGSIVSTLVLMSFIGVHNTVIFTLFLLCLLAVLISGRSRSDVIFYCTLILVVIVGSNNTLVLNDFGVVSNNAYNMVQVISINEDGDKAMLLNNSISSQYGAIPENRSAYIIFIENELISSLEKKISKPLDILVLGAAGFDLGRYDQINNYTFVDIDGDIKDVAEKYFLKRKLSKNIKFIPASARAFLNQNQKKYDLVIVDVYTNAQSVPMEATTREFYQLIKECLNSNGMVGVNIITAPSFQDRFSVRFHNTFTSVFPVFSRNFIRSKNLVTHKPNNSTMYDNRNVMYVYVNSPYVTDKKVYTDDLNTSSLDKP